MTTQKLKGKQNTRTQKQDSDQEYDYQINEEQQSPEYMCDQSEKMRSDFSRRNLLPKGNFARWIVDRNLSESTHNSLFLPKLIFFRPSQSNRPENTTRSRRVKTNKTLNQDFIYKNHYEELQRQEKYQYENGQKIQEEKQQAFLNPKIQCLLNRRIRRVGQKDQVKSLKIFENQSRDVNLKKVKKMQIESDEQNSHPAQQIETLEGQEEEQFLVKFQGKSYLRTKWMTRDQIYEEIGIQVTSGALKSMGIKIKKLQGLKLAKDQYFNPNFLQADRILSSTEIFTAIHHKKANEIKGKWDESIMLVCSKLLNFMKDGYPYGVHFHEPYVENMEEQLKISNQTNFGQLINRIYLSQFKNYQQFWKELGRAINLYFLVYKDEKGDNKRVGITIKQASIFLYEQWYNLCKERYNNVRNELIDLNLIQGQKVINVKQEAKQEDSPQTPQVEENYQQLDINQFCKTNVFLTDKIVQTPKSKEELELINPGQFSFQWLESQKDKNTVDLSQIDKKYFILDEGNENSQQKKRLKQINEKYLNYQYLQLDVEDMKCLDLNVEVDRLYLVKWKDLSYAQSTWETQKMINNPEKILEFKNWNKIPNRQTRERVEIHNKIHKFLLQFYEQPDNRIVKNPNITKMQKKLYLLDGLGKEPRQYGGKDIPIFKNYRMLKQFQLQSLNWLIKNWYENRNCILADEMGLGKTIQTISFLYHLHTYENVLGPFLVLAPLTTLPQWRRQIQQWTEFNCLLYYDQGSSTAREIIQNYQFFHLHTTKNGDIIPSKIPKFQVLLVNYELFINDFQILKKIPFQHIILDEAHRLKNKRSNTTKVLSLLPCCRKTLLTGTPIQNNTKQLFTLLNFIEPHEFPSEQNFAIRFGNLNTDQEVKQFKKMLKPYLLRRVKQDVQKTIPKLYEMIIDVQMTKKQKEVYRGLLERNKNQMIKGLSTANFNSLAIQLRKCCNHPFLISHDLELQLIKQFGSNHHEAFLKSSGKIILLMKLLRKFKNEGKKVLVFSQFVIMLDLLKEFLDAEKFNVEVLKGSLSGTIRHQAITRFNQDPNTDIFLISTKAGGVGINLISASEIVIYDSDWNPQNDIQATARAHRIGQKKEVTVYRLITSNTYEAEMFQISSKKLGLDKAVFTGECFKSSGEFNEAEKQMSKEQIQTLLKKGILGFLQNQKNQDDYFNQTIQDILQKNARKVQYVGGDQASTAYSKTKFVSQQGQNDISIDAPDFWERALKDVETPLDKLCKKGNNLKDYQTPEKQQQLMIQAYSLIYEFVRNKTVGTGFNNQDQRQLTKFLQQVSGQRKFLRKYRDIANTFLEQIQKPSRRFRVKYEQLLLNGTNTSQVKEKQPKKRLIRVTRNKNKNDDDLDLQDDDEENDAYSGVSSNDKESANQSSNEKEMNQKESNGMETTPAGDSKFLEEIERLCHSCHKPKCSVFCAGVCGRSYHKKCYQKILNNEQQIVKNDQIDELKMSFQEWKEKCQNNEKCPACTSENNIFFLNCAQCGAQGKYCLKPQKSSRKDRNMKKITDYMDKNEEDDNQSLFKCTVAKCNNFYHLSCLYKKQYENKFAYSSGKTVQDVEIPPSSTNFKLFRCPSHYCKKCYGTEQAVFTTKTSKCFKCPKAYHEKPKCMPASKFIKIMKNVYICCEHLKEMQKTEEELTQDYKPFKQWIDKNFGQLFEKQASKKKRREKQKQKRGGKKDEDFQQEQVSVPQKSTKKLSSTDKKLEQNESGQNGKAIKKKKAKAPIKLKYSYLDMGLCPVLTFDYQNYKENWCRYCGSRYAKSFKEGPWGKNTLCGHHCELWRTKRITIPDVKNPTQPIHRDKQTQIKFLNEYMSLHPKIKINQLLSVLDSFKTEDD